MENYEILRRFLETCPLLAEKTVAVDALDAVPGSCGLFPRGTRQRRRERIDGGSTAEYTESYLLRWREKDDPGKNARLLSGFVRWVQEKNQAAQIPPLGDGRTYLRAENGRMLKNDQAGTAVYETELIALYQRNYEGE